MEQATRIGRRATPEGWGRAISIRADGGALGSYFLTCAGDANNPIRQEAFEREADRIGLVSLGLPRGPKAGLSSADGAAGEGAEKVFLAESITVTLRLFQLDTNQQLRGPSNIGTVDNFRHEYRIFLFPEGDPE